MAEPNSVVISPLTARLAGRSFRYRSLGKRVLGEPRIVAHGTLIFFVHPKDMGGQLTEIMETPKGAH